MTKREMHPVSVELGDGGKIVLSQAIFDANDPDPRIELTSEQTPLVAAWLLEVSGESGHPIEQDDEQSIPVLYHARGPVADPEDLQVFCNGQGMVILKIDDDAFIEIAPSMAKRLREQLSVAIRASLSDLLRPDAEA